MWGQRFTEAFFREYSKYIIVVVDQSLFAREKDLEFVLMHLVSEATLNSKSVFTFMPLFQLIETGHFPSSDVRKKLFCSH